MIKIKMIKKVLIEISIKVKKIVEWKYKIFLNL